MATFQQYNFPTALRGDTYNDVAFIISINAVAKDLTGAEIRMWLVDKSVKPLQRTAEYTTANGKIVITDAPAGKFKIVFGKIVHLPNTYNYDIEIKFLDGTVKTWIKGIFNVTSDLTQ